MDHGQTGLTLENILSLELGSLDVVTMTLGSSTPAHLYSSSMCELTPAQTRPNKSTEINTLMIKQNRMNTDTLVLLIIARNNNTSLLPLRHHTPVVSAAAELLCVPQLEEDDFLQRKKKNGLCYTRICGRIIYTSGHLSVGKMEPNDHAVLPSSAPFSFCFFSSIVRSLSSCAFLYRYSRLSRTSRRSYSNITSRTLHQILSSKEMQPLHRQMSF